MLGASSKLILLYGIGAILGPLLAGAFMRQIGSAGFMAYMVLIYGGTGCFALFRAMKRPAVPAETAPVVQLSPVITAVTAQALAEDAGRAPLPPAASAGNAKPAVAG